MTMKTHQFGSFEEFWPFYLSEHQEKRSRLLHYFGTSISHVCLIYLVLMQLWHWLPIIFVFGYGPAWIGHFLIEKNRPATFKHPLWSLLGDYKMLYLAAAGKLGDELNNLPDESSQMASD